MSFKTYNEYIDSEVDWIGLLPSSWQTLKSKFIFNRINIQSTTGSEELLSVSEYYGVKPKKETIDDGDFLSRAESLIGYKKCSKNDLVMNIMLAWKKGLGVTEHEGIVSPAYEIFTINTHVAYPRYMNYLLRTELYTSEFKRHSYGVIDSRLRLYPDNFKEVECILPSVEEQQQIANYLDKKTAKIDATIAKNEELIQLLEEKRVALINQVITKGLNPDVPMKDSGVEWIGEIPEHWDVDCLKHNVILNAKTLTDTTDNDYEFYYVDIGSVSLENGIEKYEHMSFEDAPSRARRVVKKDDVIISTVRTYLKAIAIIPDKEDIIVSTGFAVLTPNKIDSRYLGYMVKTEYFTNLVSAHSVGVSYPAINSTDLVNLDILIPPNNEQKQIADYLDNEVSNINDIITKVTENINLLEEYKTSLIHHVVTGKIDVRGEEI